MLTGTSPPRPLTMIPCLCDNCPSRTGLIVSRYWSSISSLLDSLSLFLVPLLSVFKCHFLTRPQSCKNEKRKHCWRCRCNKSPQTHFTLANPFYRSSDRLIRSHNPIPLRSLGPLHSLFVIVRSLHSFPLYSLFALLFTFYSQNITLDAFWPIVEINRQPFLITFT